MKEYLGGSKKVKTDLSEEAVIDILINSGKDRFPLRSFANVLHAPFGMMDKSLDYVGYCVAKMIDRKELGFNDKMKPGDFDILIIPFSENEIYFNRTVASEIKVVRPTRKKPSRNANSMGVTQLLGLIGDGFPRVSLVHISMPEPLEDNEMDIIKFGNKPLDMDNPKQNIGLMEDSRNVLYDWFGFQSSEKQMQRLLAFDIPKYAGLYCTELSYYGNDSYSLIDTYGDYSTFYHGYFNPKRKEETVKKIEWHFRTNLSKYQMLLIPDRS